MATSIAPGRLAEIRSRILDLGFDGPLARLAGYVQRRPAASLALVSLILALQISPWLYATPDASRNLSVARSMATQPEITAQGSRSLWVLPGYPMLIAPWFAISTRPFLGISLEQWLLATAAVLGIYFWARRISPEAAVLITAAALLNATFTYFFRRPLKEVAYLAFLIWLVNVLHPLLQPRSLKTTIWLCLTGAVLLLITALIRYTGLLMAVVFGGALLYQAWRKQVSWVRAVAVALAVTAPAGVIAVVYMFHEEAVAKRDGSSTYLRALSDAILNPNLLIEQPTESNHSPAGPANRYWEGAQLKLSEVSRTLVPGMFKEAWKSGASVRPILAFYVVCTAIAGIGWWRLQRRKIDLLALMFPFHLLLYLPLACEQATRLMIPFLPVLMAAVWFALQPGRACRTLMTLFVLLHAGIGFGYWVSVDAPRAYGTNQKWRQLEYLANLISTDRNLVAMPSRDKARYEMEFLLDRPVMAIRDVQQWQNEAYTAEWFVLPLKSPFDETFLVEAKVRDYVLLRRRSVRNGKTLGEPRSVAALDRASPPGHILRILR